MTSTAIDRGAMPTAYYSSDQEKNDQGIPRASSLSDDSNNKDSVHRQLKSRHIQLIGIGGTIGTAIFVQIGQGLIRGGPGSLLIAFSFWCTFVLAITMCMAEMVTLTPISSPFIRFAGRYVDEAFGFAAGWNFFVFEAALVPFEVVACNIIIKYWTDVIPTAAIITVTLALYLLINLVAVKWYGETEFWAAIGKVLLMVALILFTFVVMLGGNPKGDRFGFRYWYQPGAFAELYYEGALGKWLGFLQCLIQASFAIAGPDYVSMAAGECENPRKVMPRAFNAVFYRLTAFFVLGALCVGILVPYNNKELSDAIEAGKSDAAASPYVLAMGNLGISGFPHLVNAVVLTSAFSAGNSYVYCASRSLYGLALEGKAPKVLTTVTRSGVPIYCVLVVLAFGLLSFLQLSENAAKVLNWFISLVTASQLLNFSALCVSYLCFYRALKAQGIDRKTLPYRPWGQPYLAIYGLVGTFVMVFVGGYTVFLPIEGMWSVPNFLFSYTSVFAFPLLFVGWKLVHKTTFHKPLDIDLGRDLNAIDEYERNFVPTESKETTAIVAGLSNLES